MQADVITLNVDELNDGNPTANAYTRYEELQNRTTYVGPDHTPDWRNQIQLYRSFPTKNGKFRGTGKTSVKFTQECMATATDNTAIQSAYILEVSFSVPVGTSAVDVVKMRQRAIALLDDDTVMNNLNIMLMV
jgi:hypothetical protein